LLPRATAWLIAVGVPLLVGVSRLYLNVHWATDVLGGWSGGVLLALLSVILYQRQRAVVFARRRYSMSADPSESGRHPT
jgi:undecaprenyl-diphosphatase